jgi:hypothetical protein
MAAQIGRHHPRFKDLRLLRQISILNHRSATQLYQPQRSFPLDGLLLQLVPQPRRLRQPKLSTQLRLLQSSHPPRAEVTQHRQSYNSPSQFSPTEPLPLKSLNPIINLNSTSTHMPSRLGRHKGRYSNYCKIIKTSTRYNFHNVTINHRPGHSEQLHSIIWLIPRVLQLTVLACDQQLHQLPLSPIHHIITSLHPHQSNHQGPSSICKIIYLPHHLQSHERSLWGTFTSRIRVILRLRCIPDYWIEEPVYPRLLPLSHILRAWVVTALTQSRRKGTAVFIAG